LTEPDEAERLTQAYVAHVRPVVLVLRFQGARIGEALRLDWADVRLADDWLVLREINGAARGLPMHPRVKAALADLWTQRPNHPRVFLNRFGEPYRDHSDTGGPGITKAHRTACTRAGIADFRIHDWRHHWASWMTMKGCDPRTLMELGGWSSMKMVERYAHLAKPHLKEAIARL